MSLDPVRIAAAFRALADAFEEPPAGTAGPAAAAQTTPPKRGRGRPPAEEVAPAAPAVTTPVTSDDPFGPPPAVVPTATIEQVREALTALKNATTQDNAMAVLKKTGGADNLTSLKPEHYGLVVAAAKAAVPAKVAPAEPDDPFALPGAIAAAEKPLSKEDLRALIVETQKRTGADIVQKIVFEHGGKAKNPDGSGEKPNFHALPEDQYAAVAAALKALPTTK